MEKWKVWEMQFIYFFLGSKRATEDRVEEKLAVEVKDKEDDRKEAVEEVEERDEKNRKFSKRRSRRKEKEVQQKMKEEPHHSYRSHLRRFGLNSHLHHHIAKTSEHNDQSHNGTDQLYTWMKLRRRTRRRSS